MQGPWRWNSKVSTNNHQIILFWSSVMYMLIFSCKDHVVHQLINISCLNTLLYWLMFFLSWPILNDFQLHEGLRGAQLACILHLLILTPRPNRYGLFLSSFQTDSFSYPLFCSDRCTEVSMNTICFVLLLDTYILSLLFHMLTKKYGWSHEQHALLLWNSLLVLLKFILTIICVSSVCVRFHIFIHKSFITFTYQSLLHA